MNFSIPKDENELIEKFLSYREEEQKMFLAAMLLAVEQTHKEGLLRLVDVLRTDPRTLETIARLEGGFQREAETLGAKQ